MKTKLLILTANQICGERFLEIGVYDLKEPFTTHEKEKDKLTVEGRIKMQVTASNLHPVQILAAKTIKDSREVGEITKAMCENYSGVLTMVCNGLVSTSRYPAEKLEELMEEVFFNFSSNYANPLLSV
ncbi:MAG: hypothetical protein KC516_02080 [Nanoarchaeota archaeon]|nr:hypothetical protein [Nanoarchaeota archaeon]